MYLFVFRYSSEHALFDAVELRKKEEIEYPRKYQDYTVQIHEEMIPDSVEMKRMI